MTTEAEAGIVTGEVAEPTPQEVTETETPSPAADEAAASLTNEEGGTPEGAEATEQTRENDRIRQEIDRRKEIERKFTDLEAKVAVLTKEKETVPAVDEAALNGYLGTMRDQIEGLRLQGDHLKADILDRQRNKLIDEYEAWQKQETTRRGEKSKEQEWQQAIEGLDQTSVMYRDQFKIPAPLWDEMGQWFAAEMKSNKVLETEFIDILKRQGPVSAVRFAHEQAKPVFDARAKQAALDKAKKDSAKAGQVGGGAGSDGKGSYTSFNQLMGLGSKAVAAYKQANPTHYQKLLDAHIK